MSCRHQIAVKETPAGKVVNTEAEKYPLLGVIIRQRLMKT
jgi:hypothetical protein